MFCPTWTRADRLRISTFTTFAAVAVFSSLIRAETLALVINRDADAAALAFEYPAEM
jgi:hypothetical protein